MRVLVFIFAIIVLACSVIPCRELLFSGSRQDTAKIIKSASGQQQDGNDNCSPFCSCNCCCGITFLYTTYKVSAPIATTSQKFLSHLPSKISDASLPVWQPPQLA